MWAVILEKLFSKNSLAGIFLVVIICFFEGYPTVKREFYQFNDNFCYEIAKDYIFTRDIDHSDIINSIKELKRNNNPFSVIEAFKVLCDDGDQRLVMLVGKENVSPVCAIAH